MTSEFDYVRKLVLDRSGITLDNGKEYMVESRLAPVARRHGFGSVAEFIGRLQTARVNGLHRDAVEAMTTNETYFFRDIHPFAALRTHLIPELQKRRAVERRLTIWCGASSTGQEPYSIAMLLREHFPQLLSWKVEILATDLSGELLSRAREGRYSEMEVSRGLPALVLAKYFRKQGTDWILSDPIRRMVEFRPMNLTEAWPPLPPMDLIFLRNVLIYFRLETKRTILNRISNLLKPDGSLFLGTAETTLNISDAFKRVQVDKAVSYQLAAGPARPSPIRAEYGKVPVHGGTPVRAF